MSGLGDADTAVAPPGNRAARTRAPWTLRRRLVVTIVALLAVVAVTVGAVSVLALRQNMISRLDEQVTAGLGFIGGPVVSIQPGNQTGGTTDQGGTDSGSDAGTTTPDGPGRRVGNLTLVAIDGVVRIASYTDDSGTEVPLTVEQITTLLTLAGSSSSESGQGSGETEAPVTAQPVTIDLGGELGSFRIAHRTSPDNVLVINGLSMTDVDTTTRNLSVIFAAVTLAALVLAALLGAWIVRIALRPLDRVATTAARVSERPLSQGEVSMPERVPDADADPRTEVGQVGASLNRLLGHVEGALTARHESEETLRRFIADASHELRTPLASIRGYAELSQRVDVELPPDVQRAVERIESESIRMTSLVEDLLLLARLDAGQRLDRQPVDLSLLLADAVSDAHVAGPDHAWSFEVPEDLDVEVVGDRGRLHQVVANLLANARSHTPAGTSVVAEVSSDGDEAIIRVTDDGPGIPPELQATLFERFVRGESSRSRAAGSTGLGLSIVQAIVAEHDGTVSVTSTPGNTTFEVRLPRAQSALR